MMGNSEQPERLAVDPVTQKQILKSYFEKECVIYINGITFDAKSDALKAINVYLDAAIDLGLVSLLLSEDETPLAGY